MNVKELAKIACCLNLATIKLKSASGNLNWLTGQDKTIQYDGGTQSQETQCLSWGSTVWIANNEDADTDTQQKLLNALGISTGQKLLAFATVCGRRVLPAHQGNIVVNAGSPKAKLYAKLILGADLSAGREYQPGTEAADNRGFKITDAQTGNATMGKGIVFVKGSYRFEGGDALHAEQKLLAALGLFVTVKGNDQGNEQANEQGKPKAKPPTGEIAIAGCKAPCATCKKVLDDVYKHLLKEKFPIYLRYENDSLDSTRQEAGIAADANVGIRALGWEGYFT